MMQLLCGEVWQFLKMLNRELPYDSTILLQGRYQEKWKLQFLTNLAALLLITEKMETIQMSNSWGTDKQNTIVCLNTGVLFDNKNKWSTDTCYNMDESWRQASYKRLHTVLLIWFHLHGMWRAGKSTETESQLAAAQGCGRRGRNGEGLVLSTTLVFIVVKML